MMGCVLRHGDELLYFLIENAGLTLVLNTEREKGYKL